MKIAVTYDNGQIYQHFGHTEKFKIYEVENGAVISAAVADKGRDTARWLRFWRRKA